MNVPITVVVPVGPEQHHKRWLDECLDSVLAQTEHPSAVIVDDMAGLKGRGDFFIHRPPWRLGVANAFNAGVAVAPTEWALLLGADDWLEPDAVARAWASIQGAGRGDLEPQYHGFRVRYADTGEDQGLPCGAAVVNKALWRRTGGFPPETGTGGSDAALLSILLAHGAAAGLLFMVEDGGRPCYNYRRHLESDTAAHGAYWSINIAIRDLLTRDWRPPEWGRFS